MTQRPISSRPADPVIGVLEGPVSRQLAYRTGQLLASRYVIMVLAEPRSERTLEHLVESYKNSSTMAAEEYLLRLSEQVAGLELDTTAYMEGFEAELLDVLLSLRMEILGREGGE